MLKSGRLGWGGCLVHVCRSSGGTLGCGTYPHFVKNWKGALGSGPLEWVGG